MAKLEWLETFKVGVPEIDDDHREMLSIMKSIKNAGEAEDYTSYGALLDELMVRSETHFKREEELLAEANYPNLDIHKKYHRRLITKATEMKEVCKETGSRGDFERCCDEMFAFLIDDVVAGDKQFTSFLQDKGLTDHDLP